MRSGYHVLIAPTIRGAPCFENGTEDRVVEVGLLFMAGVVPLTMFFSREPSVPILMSIYVTLGIFLLLAVRDPAANRSLIAFGGQILRMLE
jgi:succinate-acetate transporter protein